MERCPCGADAAYAVCCAPYHQGGEPPTAERLMRARHSACARHDAAFLIRTRHPIDRHRPDMRAMQASFAVDWLGLDILATSAGGAGDSTGMVHVRARCRDRAGHAHVHKERARFGRAGGCWVYRDGRG